MRSARRVLLLAAIGAPAMAAAHDGQAVFQQHCAACHSVEEGEVKIGPPLNDLNGRTIGSYPGFAYSAALRSAGKAWDQATIDAFLTAPARALPGNRMPFPGLPDPAERRALIGFLGF